MCSCCSYYGCYRVAGAAIRVTSGTVIETTCSIAVKIASGIGGAAVELAEVFTDVTADVASRTELKVQVKIRQLEELKAEELEVFSSLRLSIVFTTEILGEVLVKLAASGLGCRSQIWPIVPVI